MAIETFKTFEKHFELGILHIATRRRYANCLKRKQRFEYAWISYYRFNVVWTKNSPKSKLTPLKNFLSPATRQKLRF